MLHSLLHLLATQPNLLADHAEAYADLVTAEVATTVAAGKRRTILYASALCFTGVSVVLVGVAVMAWAVVPVDRMHAPWLLAFVPLPTIAAAVACLLAARTPGQPGAFEAVRRQIKADMAMLRAAGTP